MGLSWKAGRTTCRCYTRVTWAAPLHVRLRPRRMHAIEPLLAAKPPCLRAQCRPSAVLVSCDVVWLAASRGSGRHATPCGRNLQGPVARALCTASHQGWLIVWSWAHWPSVWLECACLVLCMTTGVWWGGLSRTGAAGMLREAGFHCCGCRGGLAVSS